MEDRVMNDPLAINEQTYEDLHMSELVDWETYEERLMVDFAAAEDNYLTEPDDEDDEDYTDEGWEDEDEN